MDETNKTIKKSKLSMWLIPAIIIIVVGGGVLYYYLAKISVGATKATVTINNCSSILPQYAAIASDKTLVFKNNDNTNHSISISGNNIIVPAGGVTELAVKMLKYGPGEYGYTCDGGLTDNEVAIVAVPGTTPMNSTGFKAMYDGEASSTQTCIKNGPGPRI